MALYKGFFPNWLRLGPWNIIVSFFLPCHVRHVTPHVRAGLSLLFTCWGGGPFS